MERQLINIGDHTFVCDKFDNSELDNLNSKASFVMLRNFKLINEFSNTAGYKSTYNNSFIYLH